MRAGSCVSAYGHGLSALHTQSIPACLSCSVGHPLIIRYFIERGIDAGTGFPFARALCHPKNRYVGVYNVSSWWSRNHDDKRNRFRRVTG